MHWYNNKGEPAYEVEGANGKMRPTTLRDARKLHLVPSVTTVMAVQDKPALAFWKQKQLLHAAVRRPYDPFGKRSKSEWAKEVVEESRKIGQAAAANGTLIHDELERMIKEGGFTDRSIAKVCQPVMLFLQEHFEGFEFVAEDSFTHPVGFGGKIDLYGVKDKGTPDERRMVLDFKTKLKSKEEMKKIKAFDDHHIQTAAYVRGIEDTKDLGSIFDYQLWERYNLFIGYDLDDNGNFSFTGLKLTESTDFEREWGMFEKLLEFWQLKNKYVPEVS